MNRTTLLIVACGCFFALIAAMAAQMIGGSGKADPQAPEAIKMASVLVAAKDLATGDELRADSVTWASWPAASIFNGAIIRDGDQKAADALKGRVRRPLAKGEPLIASAVVDTGESNFVAASLTKGMRAVSVNVNAQTAVAGFINPGDHVDVILTYEVRLPSDEKVRAAAIPVVGRLASETVLENLKVLAIDQSSAKQAEAKLVKTVTVEVDPRQAEKLILTGKMGTLSFVLRPLGDDSPTQDADAKPLPITTDTRVSGVMREILRGQNNTGSVSQVVRVYSGSNVENVEVRPYSSVQ